MSIYKKHLTKLSAHLKKDDGHIGEAMIAVAVVFFISLLVLEPKPVGNKDDVYFGFSLPGINTTALYWVLGVVGVLILIGLIIAAFIALTSVITKAISTPIVHQSASYSPQVENVYAAFNPALDESDYRRYEAKMITRDDEDIVQLLELTVVHGVPQTTILQEEVLSDDIDEAVAKAQEYETTAQHLYAQINAKEKARKAKQRAVQSALKKRS